MLAPTRWSYNTHTHTHSTVFSKLNAYTTPWNSHRFDHMKLRPKLYPLSSLLNIIYPPMCTLYMYIHTHTHTFISHQNAFGSNFSPPKAFGKLANACIALLLQLKRDDRSCDESHVGHVTATPTSAF